MLRLRFAVPLFALCLMQATRVAGQDQRPQDSGLTIRTGAQEVVLDLVVRDSRGRQVKNLQQSDVEIYEDGARQQIRSFRLVPGREIVEHAAAQPDAAKAAVANPLKAVNLVCIVFHNLDPYTKKYAVDAVQEFLNNQLQPDTWVGIFTLDSGLTVMQPFTTNKNELMQAATRAYTGHTVDFARVADAVLTASPNLVTIETTINGNPANGGTVTTTQNVTGGELNPRAIVGAEVSNSPSANAQRGDVVGQHRQFGQIEGMRSTDAMLAMINQLGTLPGRKSVLLMSPGLTTTGDADLFKAMIDKANKANITVYGIDVNGLSENSNSLASSAALSHAASLSASQSSTGGSGGANMEKMRQGDYIGDAVRTTDTQASLRGFSEGTGGFLIGSTNDLRKPFQRVLQDVDTHYEAIYHPANNKYDGHLRSIDVKTARGDVSVQSRTGYFALPALGGPPEPLPFEMTALAALNVRRAPRAFEFQSAAYQFRPAESGYQDALAFELSAANLTATPEPGAKKYRIHAALLALVKDSSGEVVDKFSQDSPYQIPEQNLASARNSTIMFTHALTLPPGHYTVETAALDLEANRASTARFEFDNQERKGVGVSSLMLVQRLEPVQGKAATADPFEFQAQPTEGRRVVPELAATLSPDAHPYLYFVVYPDKSIADKPKIQVEFLVGGQVLAKQTADLPPPDATGAIPMVIGAATKPGDCELRITALQGSSQQKQTLNYTIAAK